MSDSNVAKIYARSLIDLSKDEKVDIVKELTDFNVLINKSNEFENLLFLDVFTVDEKIDVLKIIFEKNSYSTLLKNFLNYIVLEKRIGMLPLIFKEIIVIDDHNKGFMKGTIEGIEEKISKEDEKTLNDYIKKHIGIKPELNYEKNNNITSGFKVTVGDYQVDASIDNQLDKLKETILGE